MKNTKQNTGRCTGAMKYLLVYQGLGMFLMFQLGIVKPDPLAKPFGFKHFGSLCSNPKPSSAQFQKPSFREHKPPESSRQLTGLHGGAL